MTYSRFDAENTRLIANSLHYYSELGIRIFPTHYVTDTGCSCKVGEHCEKPGKHPAVEGYQSLASSDFDDLTVNRSLFGAKFRNYDVGGLTGYQFFVVDSDRGELENLPQTWKSKSRKRGFHYFFKVPSNTVIKNMHKVIPDVDIKGKGGYVILPSEVNNREWVNFPNETELADCPLWLLEKIQEHQRTVEHTYSELRDSSAFFFGTLEEGVRNDTLFRYGCYLRSLSFDSSEIFSQLAIINDSKCDPPLETDELEDVVSSACKYSFDEDLKNILTLFREALYNIHWKGKAGKSDRSILVTLLSENEDRYEIVSEGLEVSISHRNLAEKTGLSHKTVYSRVDKAPYFRQGKPSKGSKSGTIIISHTLVECVAATALIYGYRGEMVSAVFAPHTLLFNSMRWFNLGKSSFLILEVLLERPHTRKELEEKLDYSQGGANNVLTKLKNNELIHSHKGLYSLVDDFEEKILLLLKENGQDIEEMKEAHNRHREDYGIRLEAWNRAWKDEEAIQKTAEEDNGSIYHFRVIEPIGMDNRVRFGMYQHYQRLRSEVDNQKGTQAV